MAENKHFAYYAYFVKVFSNPFPSAITPKLYGSIILNKKQVEIVPTKYLKMILNSPVYDVAQETPLEAAPKLSDRLKNNILIKREDLQSVFSFKIRGAYNKIAQLSPSEKKQGVIAASAGNHAQGVALAAAKLKISATIVMPETTPDIKIEGVKRFGAKVILFGDDFSTAFAKAQELSVQKSLVFIPPFDDPLVIAGQGTIALELLRQYTKDIYAIFIPIGGGGLISGIGAYIKTVRPEIKICLLYTSPSPRD